MSKSTTQYCDKQYFRFQKVDDYFADFVSWDRIVKATGCTYNAGEWKLALHLVSAQGIEGDMFFEVFNGRSFRLRFHPDKKADEYSEYNTRAIVQDTFEETIKYTVDTAQGDLKTDFKEVKGKYVEMTINANPADGELVVHADYDPFELTVYKIDECGSDDKYIVFHTPINSLRFKPAGGLDDYHIALMVQKPCTAKYVGFGEQGGKALVKNNTRVTYFNYDNMRYRQVYGRGPLEEREPLYHSDPFFMEVNGEPGRDFVYGLFVDNPSEVVLDMGYYRSDSYRFGIRYGVLDCYFFSGHNCGDVIEDFCALSGTPRMIPRYALGYHQGCYGYEKRDDLHEVVRKYRECGIPLDGLHVDVDIQKDYRTFTIDESKFNNPKEMFAKLREQGVKCSTNITPIISCKNQNMEYSTYREGIENGYFVTDERFEADNPEGHTYYKYGEGSEYEQPFRDPEGNYNTGKPFVGEVYYGNVGPVELGTPGHYPNLNRKEVRDWWGRQYKYLFEQGLEMVWQDMTTPCLRETRGDMLSFPSRLLVENDFVKDPDGGYGKTPVMRIWNLYSYNLHKATYHGLNNLECRKNKRNFIVGRGCFTGMQRFAALWTGDNSSSWDFLRINISQVLALGLTGQALAGQDIGGFECDHEGEQWADPELLIRWTAMGAFLPWFRNHYIRKGKKLFQEPYAYQDVIGRVEDDERPIYESVLPVCKYYIELRYRLLQLFYDAMWENALTGLPICRTLFLTDPQDKALLNDREDFLDNEFMVRQDLLIAPVVEKESSENGHGKRDVYLPAGNRWYQFVDNRCPLMEALDGGTNVCEFDAHISNDPGHIPYIVPMYVREGAVIPTIELEQYVGEKNEKGQPNIITLNIYPGEQGEYTMYLDDGVSRSSQPQMFKELGIDPEANGEYREVHISHQWTDGKTRQIQVSRVHDGYTPKYEKYFCLAVLHDPADAESPVQDIKINGKSIEKTETKDAFESMETNVWYFSPTQRISFVKVMDDKAEITVDVVYNR